MPRFTTTLRLLWLAFLDRRTPLSVKILVIIGILYGISPLDFVPDFVPFVGLIDDVTAITIVVMIFMKVTKKIRQTIHVKK